MELYRAPAKINLALEILGRRPDGFHEIASVIQAVGLYDELRVAPAETLRFTCAQSALAGADNLVVRAAQALQDATGCRRGAELRLCKGIPVAAGLGGGSSDAAAALVLLNRHWRLGLTLGELSRIGATLGSDIPFFLTGPTAVVSGRGERVELLPPRHSAGSSSCIPANRCPPLPSMGRCVRTATATAAGRASSPRPCGRAALRTGLPP